MRFPWASQLLLKLDEKSFSNGKYLYVLLKNDNPNPI